MMFSSHSDWLPFGGKVIALTFFSSHIHVPVSVRMDSVLSILTGEVQNERLVMCVFTRHHLTESDYAVFSSDPISIFHTFSLSLVYRKLMNLDRKPINWLNLSIT